MTNRPSTLRLIPLHGLPEITPGSDLAALIREAARAQGEMLANRIVVVCQKIVSKAEGRLVDLAGVEPSALAREIGAEHGRDPRQVEVVLRESRRIVRRGRGVLITETHHGFKMANAGVDASNVGGMDLVCLLPVDPDLSCRNIRDGIQRIAGVDVAIVMTDTFGRPWRLGQTNVAIGVAGMHPMRDYIGMTDLDGHVLRVTLICVADEVAGAAEMVMGKLDAIPVAIVRGYEYEHGEGYASEIVREMPLDLFP